MASNFMEKPPGVLIVDDNPLTVELVTDLLQSHGFQVYSAGTAERGIELAREFLPAVVLMDYHLPGMDGPTAARLLKADPTTRHLAIVGLTADVKNGAAPLNGFDGLLAKPFEIRTFVADVKSFVRPNSP
jgi:two-component system, cell cycle response regulator DivK